MENALLKQILDVSIALSAEKNPDILLEMIVNVAMDITNCDAGTLYINEDESLRFKIMITRSMGGRIETENLPPVKMSKSNVCACSLIEDKIINLPDVYKSSVYDFSGPKKYDMLTGYKTSSMLVIPMSNNKGEMIGVIQLINAMSNEGEIIPFDPSFEVIISALTSQAAISLTNANQQLEIENLLLSLVRVLSTAIYEQTPYNVTHTQNMTKYADKFIDWLTERYEKYKFSFEQKRQLIMSVWLHDVGKLTVPLNVMNKADRLSYDLEKIMTRFDIIELLAKLSEARGEGECTAVKNKLEQAKELIYKVNTIPFLTDELEDEIKKIAGFTYVDQNGNEKNWLNEREVTALCIKKGTLTAEERKIMETHVVMTSRILSQVSFGKGYSEVAKWASQHHEFLNGTGYPLGLNSEDLCIETRIITILDVFDGLFAKDRPYKKPIPVEKVFEILQSMVEEGKIDGEILALFMESKVWEE